MSEQEHLEWMQLAKHGDESAFTLLVQAYKDKVYSMAYYMTKNRQDAEDVAQEVFLKLWRSLDSYRADCSPSVWIMQIAKHASYDYLKQRRRRQTESLYEEYDGEQVERPLPDPDEGSHPPTAAAQKERREAVSRAILQLEPEHREVLILRYVDGMSYEQISRVLGQNQGTVKSRIWRAKKSLKKILQEGNFF